MNKTIENIKKLKAPNDIDIVKTIFSLIDLTSLNVSDTDESISAFVAKVNRFPEHFPEFPPVAGICVYNVFLDVLTNEVKDPNIDSVLVAGNFPNSHTDINTKTTEISQLASKGADEIDIVFPIRFLFSEKPAAAEAEIRKMKNAAGKAKLKVILEASLLNNDQLTQASNIAITAGADFIKTSTGKEGSTASLEAVYTMCTEIKRHYDKTGKKVGIKPAGGIRDYQGAYQYYALVNEILGKDWLNKNLFRIGASSLANSLLEKSAELKETDFTIYF